jgi:hypothetical protein
MKKTRRGKRKMTSEKKMKAWQALGLLAITILIALVIVYFVARWIAPAVTMSLVHVVSLPAYFIMWGAVYCIIGLLVLLLPNGFFQRLVLVVLAVFAVVHMFVALGLGDYALYQQYAKSDKVGNIPVPSLESAKFLPRNVAEARLKATGDNSQLELKEIDEAVIFTKTGEPHIGYAATFRPRDFETKVSGQTELVYIDAHTNRLERKRLKLSILPGGTFGSDPQRALYDALPFWDLTSHSPKFKVGDSSKIEVVPIINEADNSVRFGIPVITPKTVWVGPFPVSNIPQYTGSVIIEPISGQYRFYSAGEIEKDPILSKARLFPLALAKELAESSRFAGVQGVNNFVRALLPSNISSYANYTLAPDPEEAGEWPSLYSANEKSAYLYYPYLANSTSRAIVREVAIDADNGAAHVKQVSALASPQWIVDSILKQKLATEQLLQSSFGQFDEPTPLEIGSQRYFVFPITSKQGSQVIAYAVTDTIISDQTGQVQAEFFKTPQEIEEWVKNPVFSAQSLREVFLGQTAPKTQAQQSNTPAVEAKLEQKIDALAQQIEELTEVVKSLKK